MTDEPTNHDGDQLRQRRANFEELQRLGIAPYPHAFERTDTIQALVAAHGQKDHDALEAERVQTRTAGRILAIRSFGKANFLVISDGAARIQVYLPEGCAERARLRDCSSCSISATTSASRGTCSARRRTS